MRQGINKRLKQLEQILAQARRLADIQAQHDDDEAAIRKIEIFLKLQGVEQEGEESLAETLARALGITLRELREQLMAGIDPIHKYFTDQGVFEEIERRKAAGTWPSG